MDRPARTVRMFVIAGFVLIALALGLLAPWAIAGSSLPAGEDLASRNYAGAEYDAEYIVARVQDTTARLPAQMRFRQDVDLRIAFMNWNFHTEVEKDEHGVHFRTIGGPSFLPENLSGELVDVAEALHRFDVRLVDTEYGDDGGPVYVLEGERRPELEGGADRGKIWVDGDKWQVHRVVAEYPWGRLEVDQRYQPMGAYTVLAFQRATLSPWAAIMTITYRDYELIQASSDPSE